MKSSFSERFSSPVRRPWGRAQTGAIVFEEKSKTDAMRTGAHAAPMKGLTPVEESGKGRPPLHEEPGERGHRTAVFQRPDRSLWLSVFGCLVSDSGTANRCSHLTDSEILGARRRLFSGYPVKGPRRHPGRNGGEGGQPKTTSTSVPRSSTGWPSLLCRTSISA